MEQSKTIVLSGIAVPESDDGGLAKIVEIGGDEFFARIQSWKDDRAHSVLDQMAGRRIKITIEIGEDVISDLITKCAEAEALYAVFERRWKELHFTGFVPHDQNHLYASIRQALGDRITVLRQQIADSAS